MTLEITFGSSGIKSETTMMKLKIILIVIIILAFFLRFYKLATVPPSLYWDEASLGWNAEKLALFGTDEYGTRWPFTIRSFNDYKPPLDSYLSIVPVKFLGLNEFSVRLISALSGIIFTAAIFLLSKNFLKGKLPFFAALLSAVNPWSLQFSRGAFEANLGLALFTLGLAVSLNSRQKFYQLLAGQFLLFLSVYAYHANKIVAPLAALILITFFLIKKELKGKQVIILLLSAGVLLLPFAQTLRQGTAAARFEAVKIESLSALAKNYAAHFNFDFLFLSADNNPRHHVLGFGLFYLFESILALIGLFTMLKKKHLRSVFFLLFGVTLIPAAIAVDAPHAIRSLLSLPFFLVLIASGVGEIAKTRIIKILLVGTYLYFIFFFLHAYFKYYPVENSAGWQYGYRQVADYIFRENNYAKYNKIIITTAYDQPYIYMLFYGEDRFRDFINDGAASVRFDKFEFKSINLPQELQQQGDLIIGTEKEIQSNENLLKTIYFLDGKVAFKIVKT